MLFLLVLIIVMLVFRVVAIFALGADRGGLAVKQSACKSHSWSYNHEDKLQCTKCNFVAGLVYEEE